MYIVTLFFVLILKLSVTKTSVHEMSCQLSDKRATLGTCVNVKQCSAYVIGLLKVGLNPTVCKLKNDPNAVCCPTVKRIKCEEFTNVLRQPIPRKSKSRRKLILQSNRPSTPPIFQNITTIKPDENDIICPMFLPTRISGGRSAFKDEYPHQVALGYGSLNNTAWRCGGVLISTQFVLTAGHCVTTKYGPPVRVMVGDRVLSTQENPKRQIMEVKEIHAHPEYKPLLLYNDLALIKLTSDVTLSRSIIPACLPQPQYRFDKKGTVTVTGFGQLGAIDAQSDTLQSVDLQKFSITECSDTFMNDTAIRSRLTDGILPSQFCAGDKEGNKDTCHGDSGGPATVTKDNPCVFYVVGITSFGSSFCGFQQPGVYSNVLRYLEWIENAVWPVTPTDDVANVSHSTSPDESTPPITLLPVTPTISTIEQTSKMTPHTQRPKISSKPMFLVDTAKPSEHRAKTSGLTLTTTPKPSTPRPPPEHVTSKPSITVRPHLTTRTRSTTAATSEVMTLKKTDRTTQNPELVAAATIVTGSSPLLNKILKFGKNITTKNTTEEVTSAVSTILSLTDGI
ncbi:serine protease snake-like isoform X2 [Folsomia candida]|uniref:serine protease snake-like isoform X2 n=1 Tax=Folsomia candida TaxID=158441 RepID=UPI00160539E8|nr:serine protease snake-like isoform X2 [Folsomia candida]